MGLLSQLLPGCLGTTAAAEAAGIDPGKLPFKAK